MSLHLHAYKIIRNYLDGFAPSTIADMNGLKRNAVTYILNRFQSGKNLQTKNVQKKKENLQIEKIIETYLSEPENAHHTVNEIRTHVITTLHKDETFISRSSIHRIIQKLGYTRKRFKKSITSKNEAKLITQRKAGVEDLLDIIADGRNLIFLDETGFNFWIRPTHGYAKKGRVLTLKIKPKCTNISVVAAVMKNKLIGFQIFEGSVSSKDFGGFLIGLILQNKDILINRDKWAFVMDNATTHKSKIIKPFLSNFHKIYLPPYSPFLNPIELVFSWWKNNFRKLSLTNNESIYTGIIEAIHNITPTIIYSYYVHTFSFYLSCLNSEKIN